MRAAWLAIFLVAATLSGCTNPFKDNGEPRAAEPVDVGYDPAELKITGTRRTEFTVSSFDGVNLASVVYEPISPDSPPEGGPPRWPVVVFLHGFGSFKESFEGLGGVTGLPVPEGLPIPYTINRLEDFALGGMIAVAYDARGFGQSGGEVTVAGAAERADLDAVLDSIEANYHTNGFVGVVGGSYGGGQAFQAWAGNDRVTTAVPMYGWVDLYEALVTGNVPKLEWSQYLYVYGLVGSRGRYAPIVHEWYQSALLRQNLDIVKAQMETRSSLQNLASTNKPLFVCQGMQETLFPQIDLAWTFAGGFTRAYVYTGGHGTTSEPCWSRALDWFRFFLGGYDTRVDGWPALTTQDADGTREVDFDTFPQPTFHRLFLRNDTLDAEPSSQQFSISQQIVANPFNEPSGLWDLIGQPNNAIPNQFRQDPTGLFFASQPVKGTQVVVGAPVLTLKLVNGTQAPFQVTGILFHEDAMGKSRILSRAAFAALDADDIVDDTVQLRFHWTKADLAPGDRVVLKLDANDESWWFPYPGNYEVSFTGESEFLLPFFETAPA